MNSRFCFFFPILSLAGFIFCEPLISADLQWYKSSPGASKGEPLSDGGKTGMGWTLSVEIVSESESLSQLAQPVQDQHSLDRTAGNHQQSTHTLERRILYLDNEIQSIEKLNRRNGVLRSWETLDSNGNPVSNVDYSYAADEMPQTSYINSFEPDAFPASYVSNWTMIQADGPNIRRTYGMEDDWSIVDMDSTWKPAKGVIYNDGKKESEQTWIRGEDGQLISTTERRGNTLIEKKYNGNGMLSEERIQENGILKSVKTMAWDGTNLVREEYREGRVNWYRDIIWDDDRIKRDTLYVDDLKNKEIEWIDSENRVETHFESGNAMVRVYWNNEKRWKEEFLHNGSVVRTRKIRDIPMETQPTEDRAEGIPDTAIQEPEPREKYVNQLENKQMEPQTVDTRAPSTSETEAQEDNSP